MFLFIGITIYAHFEASVTVIINKNDKVAKVLFKSPVGIAFLKFREDTEINKNGSKYSILFKLIASAIDLKTREGARLNKKMPKCSVLFKQTAPAIDLKIREGAQLNKITPNCSILFKQMATAINRPIREGARINKIASKYFLLFKRLLPAIYFPISRSRGSMSANPHNRMSADPQIRITDVVDKRFDSSYNYTVMLSTESVARMARDPGDFGKQKGSYTQ